MAIEIPCDDIDTDKIGGFDRVAKGIYHTEITFLDEDGGDKGEMIVDFEVLRGSAPNQEGRVHREYFSKVLNKELPRRKFFALAIAAGLITAKELDELKKQGKTPVIDYNLAVGKQVVIDLEENEYQGRVSTRIAFDRIFHPAATKANDCPLHVGKIQAAKILLPANRNPDGMLAMRSQKATATTKDASAKTAEPTSQAASVDEIMKGM